MCFQVREGILKHFLLCPDSLYALFRINFIHKWTHTRATCLPLNAVYVLRTQWYGSRPVCLVELSIKWERRAVVSHCGLASGELGKQIGWSSFASHTHSHAHILCKQSALFPSIPALCSQSVQKAAGLMKWKWLIIMRAMTAAVSRHHTLAYLWHCVRGAVLYCTNTLSIYTFFNIFFSLHTCELCCVGSTCLHQLQSFIYTMFCLGAHSPHRDHKLSFKQIFKKLHHRWSGKSFINIYKGLCKDGRCINIHK